MLEQADRDNKPARVVILKARQLGISTFGAGYTYYKCVTNPYLKGMVIADDSKSTNNLFTMHKRFYDFCDKEFRPLKRYSNERALVFENPNDEERSTNPGMMSSIHVETAGKDTAGRSGTLQILHCSEFAFWDNAGTVKSGLFQSVPHKPGTMILIESTANGVEGGKGEEFYNVWQAAVSGDSSFAGLFFPWWENEEYQLEASKDFKPDSEEIEIKKQFNLTNNQLAWRRYKIQNEMGSAILNPVDQFRQEYPSYPQEAFITSGRKVFDTERLYAHIQEVSHKEPKRGSIDNHGRFIRAKDGPLKVFSEPRDTINYAIGADVAEGLETGDFSSMCVMGLDYKIHATYFDHIAPDLFGRELCRVGGFYNNAILAPEVNNHGHTTLSKIKDLSYYKIYQREVKEEFKDKHTQKLGWQTNVKTKMLMLDEFVGAYRDNLVLIEDVELLKEMMTLTIESDGSVNLNGKDRVVAACIALQALKQVTGTVTEAFTPTKLMTKPKNLIQKHEWAQKKDYDYYD